MARNDQVTRQWHLLRRLEGSTGLTLQALAAGLPDDFPNTSAPCAGIWRRWRVAASRW